VDGLIPFADAAGSEHGKDRFHRLFLGRRKLNVVGVGEPVGAYGSLVKPRPLLDEGPVGFREREEPLVTGLAGGCPRQAPAQLLQSNEGQLSPEIPDARHVVVEGGLADAEAFGQIDEGEVFQPPLIGQGARRFHDGRPAEPRPRHA
jgi:hypothetical protein